MISFSTAYTSIGIDENGSISQVPINGYLQSVRIDKTGVMLTDSDGNWGYIRYQDTSYNSNIELYNYLYPFGLINKPQTKKIEICSADLKTCNSTPITLVTASGIGLINLPISLGYNYKYLSVVYDFAQNLFVHSSTKTDANPFFEINKGVINAAANRSATLTQPDVAGISSVHAIAENDSIVLKAKTSNAITGDGYLVLYLTYVVVEESWYDGVYCT